MSRYVPRTYNNRRILRVIIRLVVSAALAVAVLFIVLFFWLKEKYAQPYPDGTFKLEIPFILDSQQPP